MTLIHSPVGRSAKGGFTLVEILVAAAITVVLMAILLRITTLTSTAVTTSTQRLSAFASARTAFDIMTRTLSQATLNTYLDYYDGADRRTNSNAASFQPTSFGRASDLQFIIQGNQSDANCGQEVYFQAPRAYSADANLQSVQGLLNACGYYVQFGNSDLYEPAAVKSQEPTTPAKYRYRLMQGMEPTEYLQVFQATSLAGGGTTTDSSSTWLTNIVNGSGKGSEYVSPLADNVIALILWPRESLNNDPTGYALLGYPTTTSSPATTFVYDSQRNLTPTGPTGGPFVQSITADQLPPDIQLTMVVLDEASAVRAQATSTNPATSPPSAIENALSLPTPKFQNAANYATDLSNLATSLSASHFNFQFFTTTIALRESKWSTPQQ